MAQDLVSKSPLDRAQAQLPDLIYDGRKLCPSCSRSTSSGYFKKEIFQTAYARKDDTPVKEFCFGLVRQMNPEECSLCRFIHDILSAADEAHAADDTFCIRNRGWSGEPETWPPIFQLEVENPTSSMAIESVELLTLPSQSDRAELLFWSEFPSWFPQAKVNFGRIKYWLNDENCPSPIHMGAYSTCHQFFDTIPILLIDCNSLSVVEANSSWEYCALSYVWGDSTATPVKDAPATIQDAITVTKRLGMDYLWVDRYCISSNDVQTKHVQIQNMHKIYGQAKLTIVAAASNSPDYGLPGVNKRDFRPRLPAIRIGDLVLSAWRPIEKSIRESAWASRGWTYQESLFSTRTLIFTDSFVALDLDQLPAHYERHNLVDPRLMREQCLDWDIFPIIPKRPETHQSFYDSLAFHIEEFSSRSLTYDADRLNGLLGLLQAFQEHPSPIYHYYGIVFTPETPDIFSDSLVWKISPDRCSRRIYDYPSWSWTGWTGKVEMYKWYRSRYQQGAIISVELSDSSRLRLDDREAIEDLLNKKSNLVLSKILRVDGWMFEVKFGYMELGDSAHHEGHEHPAFFCHYRRELFRLQLVPCSSKGTELYTRLTHKRFLCVIAARLDSSYSPIPPKNGVLDKRPGKLDGSVALVLDDNGDNTFKRIGTIIYGRGISPKDLGGTDPDFKYKWHNFKKVYSQTGFCSLDDVSIDTYFGTVRIV